MRPAVRSIALVLPAVISAVALLAGGIGSACAQGGPPMVTDDPETPGDGKWEINLAGMGSRTRAGRWEVSVPDADINYGWGDRIQLRLDVPWTFTRDPGERWKSGLGAGNVGVKWRFVDIGDHGFSMSTYPQYLSGWLASSRNRGITSDEKEFLLPLEIATDAGEWGLDGEIGRNFIQNGSNQWVVGGIAAHACGEDRECLIEVHEAHAPRDSHTLVNLGLHWKLTESAILLASAGREIGARSDEQQSFLFYLGVQLLR
jgi:hypothetical protein